MKPLSARSSSFAQGLKKSVVVMVSFHHMMIVRKLLRGERSFHLQVDRGDQMRNSLGGLIGILIGSLTIVLLLSIPDPVYSWPYSSVWFIFSGSNALKSSIDGLLNLDTTVSYILTWIIVGLFIAPFSKKGWNTLRSALWGGLFLGIIAIASHILLHTEFWIAPTRNIELFYHFAISILVSLFALLSAIPTTFVIERIRKQSEEPIPEKIETSCECGAIFKSNPLICSECGRQLRERKP